MSELRRNSIDNASEVYSFKTGDAVYHNPLIHCQHSARCKCRDFKRCIKGKIVAVDAAKYWPQMSPPYLFAADSETEQQFTGWIYEA